jgi:hypothetical protein
MARVLLVPSQTIGDRRLPPVPDPGSRTRGAAIVGVRPRSAAARPRRSGARDTVGCPVGLGAGRSSETARVHQLEEGRRRPWGSERRRGTAIVGRREGGGAEGPPWIDLTVAVLADPASCQHTGTIERSVSRRPVDLVRTAVPGKGVVSARGRRPADGYPTWFRLADDGGGGRRHAFVNERRRGAVQPDVDQPGPAALRRAPPGARSRPPPW